MVGSYNASGDDFADRTILIAADVISSLRGELREHVVFGLVSQAILEGLFHPCHLPIEVVFDRTGNCFVEGQ